MDPLDEWLNNSTQSTFQITEPAFPLDNGQHWNTSTNLTVNTSEIEYHPILVPISSSPTNPSIDSSKPLTGAENVKTWNQSRRPSQDSGFFNVPTPPGSFSESSSSPSNTPSMLLDFNSIPPPPEDLELDKIVDDVDDMFREQLDKKAQEDLEENISLIKRNLPAKKDGQITSFLRQTTQDIADQIARNLVDRALELDRKRLVKKIAKSRKTKTTKGGERNCNEDEEDQEGQDQGSLLLESERSLMLSNFVEVAINRVTEQIISDLLQNAKNDMANVLHHKFNGNPTLLRWLDVSKDNTQTLLDKELSKLVSEFENKKTPVAADSTLLQTPEASKKSNSPAKMKRQKLRRARTKNGLLISSLKKKIYHCNCIDCQAKRKSQGKPAYLEPIDIEEMDLGDLPETIPLEKKKSRGRPRKYPRLEDVLRYKESQQKKKAHQNLSINVTSTVTSLEVVVSESINEKAIQTDSNSEAVSAIKRTSSEPPVAAPSSLIKTEDNKSHEDTMGDSYSTNNKSRPRIQRMKTTNAMVSSKKSQIGSQDILARKSGREKRSRKPAPKSEFIVRRPLRMLE